MDKEYSTHLKLIRNQHKHLLETLINWSNQNSHTDNTAGLKAMHKLLTSAFAVLGGTVTSPSIPPRKIIDKNGLTAQIEQGSALRIVKRPKAPIRLLLAGHMDTVFPAEHPFQKTSIKGSQLRGPGVADMKGGLLIMLKALEVLEQSPWAENIGWEVLITPDEEAGSNGSAALYEAAAKKHHAGLLFEPAFSDGALVSSRKGSSNLYISSHGRSAHAGRDFFSGKNALTPLFKYLLNIEQLTNEAKGITVNIGQVVGGEAFNIVPDAALAKVNVRVDTAEDAAVVSECLQMLLNEINGEEGASLTMHAIVSRPPKLITPETQQLFRCLQECQSILGGCLEWRPSGGVCDGNILSACGLPTLDTLGAVGGNLHTADEYINIDSLVDRASLTALFLLKLASGEATLPFLTRPL